jgi:hypothetical protein
MYVSVAGGCTCANATFASLAEAEHMGKNTPFHQEYIDIYYGIDGSVSDNSGRVNEIRAAEYTGLGFTHIGLCWNHERLRSVPENASWSTLRQNGVMSDSCAEPICDPLL